MSDSVPPFVTGVAAVAAMVGIAIPLLQTDTVSKHLLSPERLQAKRQAEYQYRWNWQLEKACVRNRGGRDQEMDRQDTEVFLSKEEVKAFIETVAMKKELRIVSIEVDDRDARREYFIFLENQDGLYQLPLITFGTELAKVMEDQITSTALCFIADASSGLGPHILTTVLEECKAGVAVIREPVWLALFASLMEKRIITTESLERVLFALCRLEAWRVRDQIGAARTVVFVLPGQACSPVLAPILQKIFPCERHLFVYDGCVASVERALVADRRGSISTISSTTPMVRVSLTRRILNLSEALSKLPLSLADTTEAWMTSVDAFLQLKEEERANDYLPFVLKLSLLLEDGDSDQRRLALTNVLQFVTGSRSRPISDAVLDAAVESLRAIMEKQTPLPNISEGNQKKIEDCVFRHKGILIGDKTLMDTVLPAKEWTLKSAKKISGCLCCAPEEEYEDDEEDGVEASGEVNDKPGAFAMNTTMSRPKYVDGKTAFAFDPTQFS